MNRLKSTLAIASLALFGFSACTPTEDSASVELRERTAALSSDLTRQIVQAILFLEDIESFDRLDRGFEALADVLDWGNEGEAPEVPEDVKPEIPPAPAEGEYQEESIDPDEAAQSVEDFLTTCILAADNLESEVSGRAVYLLPGSLLCSEECLAANDSECDWTCEGADSRCQEELQACQENSGQDRSQCEADIDALQVRVTVRENGEGVAIALQVAAERYTLASLNIQAELISINTVLDELKQAVVHISSVIDEEAIAVPEIMVGKLSVRLEKDEPGDFSLRVAIEKDIRIVMEVPEGQGMLELNIAKAEEAFSIRVVEADEILAAMVALNPMSLILPFAEVQASGDGDLKVEVSGLKGILLVSGPNDLFPLIGLGLGNDTSRILHNDEVILSVDLNAIQERQLDLFVNAEGDLPIFALDPGVLLQAYVNFGHLDAYLEEGEEPAPPELCDQTYTLSFFADQTPAQIRPVEADENQGGAIEIVAGSLQIRSDAMETTLDAEAGQCLFPIDECEAVQNSIIECWHVSSCR